MPPGRAAGIDRELIEPVGAATSYLRASIRAE
jgi:hypothetical protein